MSKEKKIKKEIEEFFTSVNRDKIIRQRMNTDKFEVGGIVPTKPEIKFYDFSKPEDCAELKRDYGEGSTVHAELKNRFIGANIQKDEVSSPDGKNHFKVEAQFKAIDNLSPAIFQLQKAIIEKELERELTDYEAEQIIAFKNQELEKIGTRSNPFKESKIIMASTPLSESETKSFFFRQFMNDEITCDDYIKLTNDEELKWKPSEKRNVLFDTEAYTKVIHSILGEATFSNLKSIERYSFKKRKFSLKNLIDKVVKWWKE